jgi:signal transduction histidine kinase
MEGFDKEWVRAGKRREARYTNLDAGEYVFHVMGSNNDGVWDTAGTRLQVAVIPPFWQAWWFLGVLTLTGAGVVGGTVRFVSTQKLKKRIAQLEREKAIQDERQRTRERIARDLHDDLASTVGSAGLFLESVKHQLPDAPLQAREFLDRTSSLLTEAEQAMSDIVWSVSPQHDTLDSLALRIRLHTADVCKAAGIRHEVAMDLGSLHNVMPEDVRRNIFLVFKEAVNNAARHSEATNVQVSLRCLDDAIELTVCDDGRGIPEKPIGESKRGHGLRNMELRAKEIGAEFSIATVEGKGTTIRVTKRMT